MTLVVLGIGFVFGFVGSIPIAGPIGLLVFAYGMENRWRQALLLAVGSSLAEGGYAYLAFWGTRSLLARYPFIVPYTSAAGSLVLAALGVHFMVRQHGTTETKEANDSRRGTKRSFAIGLGITALNPTLIVTWTAAATTLFSSGLLSQKTTSEPLPFALGATAGIVAWFATLLALIQRYRTRVSHAMIANVVRAVGGVLILLSVWFACKFVGYLIRGER